LLIPVKNESGMPRFEALKNELNKIDGIVSVSASSNVPGEQFNQHSIASIDYPDDEIASSEIFVDYDFFDALGLTVAEGRTFSPDNPGDSSAFILNETAARQLNISEPVAGKEIWWVRHE